MSSDVRVRLRVDSGNASIGLSADDGHARLGLGAPSIVTTVTTDYEQLENKPQIEDVVLVGNRSLGDFGMGTADRYDVRRLFRH